MELHLSTDTIAAIATAPNGGIGVLRLSGSQSFAIAKAVFAHKGKALEATPRELRYGRFVLPHTKEVMDEGLAVAFRGPNSFTGEDLVELHLHGGALHLRRCLEVLISQGARLAEAGEFTRRAFLNGKLDLTRAEAIADLVSAQTDAALKHARSHLQGALYEHILAQREALLNLRARLEVNVDFVEEDVPIYDPSELATEAAVIAVALDKLADTYHRARRLREGASVVLAGPPNAGKSSLFNALCEVDRAIVTPIAGTTRDTLREAIDINGIPVLLIDTAGLRDTDDIVEREGVSRAQREIERADLLLHLIPPEGDPTPPETETRTLHAYSKADMREDRPGLCFSVTTGEGLEALKDAIATALGELPTEELLIARERQHLAIKATASALHQASVGLFAGDSPELPAVDLQEAMDQLDQLVGNTTIEDMLDRLFSTFCIGK